jgi:succinate dehydrogenase hydrophobic anchor subunit
MLWVCWSLVFGSQGVQTSTREHENPVLQSLSMVVGVLLIAISAYSMFTAGGTVWSARYVVPFMMIQGLSLCARWLESIHVTAVLILMVGLGILLVLGQGGMPQSITDLLQKQNTRKLIIIAFIVLGGGGILIISVEKLLDLVLGILGQGLVVTRHGYRGGSAVLILSSGDSRGLIRYL